MAIKSAVRKGARVQRRIWQVSRTSAAEGCVRNGAMLIKLLPVRLIAAWPANETVVYLPAKFRAWKVGKQRGPIFTGQLADSPLLLICYTAGELQPLPMGLILVGPGTRSNGQNA